MAELKEILEALIFVHRGPLDRKTMEEVLKEDFDAGQVGEALEELRQDLAGRGGVVELAEVAGGFQFETREDVAEWIGKMDHYEHHRHLSRPALETLAIVAYRQPVTRQEIEQIRGVNVERILRGLLDKKLVKILGRKDLPGKPIVYGTTADFLRYFGLGSLSDLPSLKEFAGQEIPGGGEEEEVEILPLEDGSIPPDAAKDAAEDAGGMVGDDTGGSEDSADDDGEEQGA